MQRVIDEAVEKGFVYTILNRRRYLPEIRSTEARVRSLAERIARNTGIQGSAADLIKVAMNRIHQRIRNERGKTRMLLQIHDELLFEAPAAEAEGELDWISKEMEGAMELNVPLKVKTSLGKNWREV
jgi:DNA polymerase-1